MHRFPTVQGPRLREIVVARGPITVSNYWQPVVFAQDTHAAPPGLPSLAFLYPRPRPTIRDSSHSTSYRLSTPSLAQYCPCTTDRWTRSCITTLSHQNISKSLRTMKDPVQRTASPYTDPSVKGPRSQQLFSHTHSLLHNHKSELFLNPPSPASDGHADHPLQ